MNARVKRIDPRPAPDAVAVLQSLVKEYCDGHRISRDDAIDMLARLGKAVPPEPTTMAQWAANRRARDLCDCACCWSLHQPRTA